MLNKILTIAWTNIYITYSDRGALLLILLAPVVLSTIIGLAFGQGTNDISLEPAEVVVINQDAGISETQNWGQIYADILTENDPEGLGEVVKGAIGDDLEAARAQVLEGELNAVVFIPADFSAKTGDKTAQVEVIYNSGEEIQASIVLSVVEAITAQINTGLVGTDILLGEPPNAETDFTNPDAFAYWVQQAIANGKLATLGTVAEEALPKLYEGDSGVGITLKAVNFTGEANEFDALQYFAPSMAIMFMTFTMAAGTRGILEEHRQWTLQRILTTPTPRWVFMLGKLFGTYGTGLIQMSLLILIMPLVAALMGRTAAVWGTNYLGVALITLAVVGAATGLGLLLAAASASPRQADNLASAVLVIMAMVSGSFINVENVPVLNALSKFTLNNWAIVAYTDLSSNQASVSAILPNVAALLGMAVLFFGVAVWRFNHRLDI